MDPITHALLGGALAHAALPRRLAGRAWLVGAVAALAPDLDTLIRSPADPLLVVEHHRGFTHALAFAPVGALAATLPWLASRKQRAEPAALYAAALLGYASHGPLDAATTYGTQLFWPFASLRVALNVISIVDPFFTLALLVGLVLAVRTRAPRPAQLALVFCAAYLALGSLQRARALDAQREIARERAHARARGAVFPTLANQIVWRSLYASGDSLYADRIRVPWFGAAAWTGGSRSAAVREARLPAAVRADARTLRDFRRFRWFSDGWVAVAPDDPELLGDARYSRRTDRFDPVWGIRLEPGADPPTRWVDRSRERELGMRGLWREIRGRPGD